MASTTTAFNGTVEIKGEGLGQIADGRFVRDVVGDLPILVNGVSVRKSVGTALGAGFEMMTFSTVLARCGVGGGRGTQWCVSTGETPVVPVVPLGDPQGALSPAEGGADCQNRVEWRAGCLKAWP